ncbi:MAG: hypothetical protein R3B06_02995 [Kofleriaceae bacterium]
MRAGHAGRGIDMIGARARWVLGLAAAAACRGDGTPAMAPHAPRPVLAAPVPPVDEAGGLVVLDTGASPRQRLRYRVEPGTVRQVEYASATPSPDGATQHVAMTWTYSFADARPDAGSILSMRLVTSSPPMPAPVSGRWGLDEQGRHASVENDVGRELVRQSQTDLMLPIVPAAPVGVGATWTLPMGISVGVGSAPIPGQARWRLVSIEAATAVVQGTFDVPPTTVPFRDTRLTLGADGEIDARVDLTSYTATAQLRLDLRITPTDVPVPPMESRSTIDLVVRAPD